MMAMYPFWLSDLAYASSKGSEAGKSAKKEDILHGLNTH